MSNASMPSFGNFMKPKPALPSPSPADVPTVALPPPKDDRHKRKDKSRRKDESSRHSHRDKHKSKHKRRRHHSRSSSSSEDELKSLDAPSESRKAAILKEELQSSEQPSSLFSIRRMPDRTSYKSGGIHKLDRPDYHKSYMGAIGVDPKSYISWSPDLRTFELSDRFVRRDLESGEKRKIRAFEGRYCARGAVASIGRPIRKKSAPELESEAATFGPFIIPVSQDLDSQSDSNFELEEQEVMERRFMERNKKLNAIVSASPHDIQAWLELINLQDEFASLATGSYRKTSIGAIGTSKVTLERKLDMFGKAISLNPKNLELIVGRFETMQRLHDAKVVNAEWAIAISKQSDSAPLWLAYLRFVQSNFNQFSISHFRTVYSTAIRYLNRVKLQFLDSLLAFEGCIAELLVRAITVEYQAGYRERAVAIYQATLEINFFPPEIITSAFDRVKSPHDLGLLSAARHLLLSNFATFWEAGLPRFGEADAKGWRANFNTHSFLKPSSEVYDPLNTGAQSMDVAQPSIDEELQHTPQETSHLMSRSDLADERFAPSSSSNATNSVCQRVQQLIQQEKLKDELHLIPLRPDQMEDDVDSVVLFEDLKEILIYFSHPEAKNFILTSYFELLGVSLKPFQTTNSELIQARLLESEDLSDAFFILDREVYPKMASTSYTEGEVHSDSMPIMHDFLDSSIKISLTEASKKQLARSSLEQALNMSLGTERLNELRTLQVLLDGDEKAKQLLVTDQENIVLWNAYVRLLTSDTTPKKPIVIRRTYTKVIQSFSQNAQVIQAVKRASQWENLRGDKKEALEALFLLSEASLSSASPASEPHHIRLSRASIDYSQRFTSFSYGIRHSIASTDSIHIASSPIIAESLEVYFDLTVSCALLEEISNGPNAADSVFISARTALADFATIAPSLHSKVMWYTERLWMHQLSFLALEYERKNLQVPMGHLRTKLESALAIFPSNVYFLSLFVIASKRSNLLAHSRRYFDLQLLHSSKQPTQSSNRLLTWLFSARSEIQRGAYPRISRQMERALQFETKADANLPQSVLLWKLWLEAEVSTGRFKSAKNLLFRAIQSCPWNKSLWITFLDALSPNLSHQEVEDILSLMNAKEIRLRNKFNN